MNVYLCCSGHYAGEWIPLDHDCLPVSDTFISNIDRSVIHWRYLNNIYGTYFCIVYTLEIGSV